MPGTNPLPPLDPRKVYHDINDMHPEYDAQGNLIGYSVISGKTLYFYGARVLFEPQPEPKDDNPNA